MLCSIILWNVDGTVVGTLGVMVPKDENGNVLGVIDFEAHEQAGGRLRDIVYQDNATGAGTWPEWLGGAAHDFTVELDSVPSPARAKITALIHKQSGHRRDRGLIEAEISERIAKAQEKDEAADLRDLLGGPNRPLKLDQDGKTRPRPARSLRPSLPVVRRATGRPLLGHGEGAVSQDVVPDVEDPKAESPGSKEKAPR